MVGIDAQLRTKFQDENLDYILDMMDQLAELAGGIDEHQLGGALRCMADMRRSCVPPPKDPVRTGSTCLPN